MATPSDIEVIIHYYCFPVPHPRFDAPAVQGALNHFLAHGLIVVDCGPSGYATTPKATAWIKMLCATPYPRMAWTDGKSIVVEAK